MQHIHKVSTTYLRPTTSFEIKTLGISFTLSLSLSLSLTHTHTHTHILSLSLILSFSFSLFSISLHVYYVHIIILKTLFFFKNGQTPTSFAFIFCLFKQTKYFFSKSMWKMSIQFMAPGFRPTTSPTWVVSQDHKTRANVCEIGI